MSCEPRASRVCIVTQVSHFHFTHDAIELKWRKLDAYEEYLTSSRTSSSAGVQSDDVRYKLPDPVHLAVTSNRSSNRHTPPPS